MPRAKRGFKRRTRVKKVRDRAEGFSLGRRTMFRRAAEAVRRALWFSYQDRRKKKRDFRKLWVTRLSAASRDNDMSYSQLISALNRSNIDLNRKVLSDIAIADPQGFSALVDQVRSSAASPSQPG